MQQIEMIIIRLGFTSFSLAIIILPVMKASLKLAIIFVTIQLSLSSCINIKELLGFNTLTVNFPPGDYVGTAKQIQNGTTLELAEAVKLTFLPKEVELQDGIGVLVMKNNSQRFFWRTDGNNTDSWNVLFHKDQNLYTNMQESFKFDGLITASEIQNKLEGRLHFNNHTEMSDYYIEAFQNFPPELYPPKEAIEIKGGDDIVIAVGKIGKDQDAIQVLYKENEGKKEAQAFVIRKIETTKEGTNIVLATDKKIKKGSYSLYLLRGTDYKTQSLPFEVK